MGSIDHSDSSHETRRHGQRHDGQEEPNVDRIALLLLLVWDAHDGGLDGEMWPVCRRRDGCHKAQALCDASASDGHARSTGRSDIGARVELTFNATLDLLFFRPFRFDLFHNQFADLTMAASSAFSDLRDKARLVFSRAEEPSDDASEQQPDRLDEIAQYCPQLTWQQVRQATCERVRAV
jgi:hypothetical protein